MPHQNGEKKLLNRVHAYINSIKTKLVVSFLIITLTPLIYISYVMLQNASNGLLNVIVSNSLAHARKTAIDLRRFISHQQEVAQLLVNSDPALDQDIEKLALLAQEHDRRYFAIEKIGVYDTAGRRLCASVDTIFTELPHAERILAETKSREYVLLDFKAGSGPMLAMSLNDRGSNSYGLLVIELNRFLVTSIISENLVGNSTRAFLVDAGGTPVVSVPESSNAEDLSLFGEQIRSFSSGVFSASAKSLKKPVLASMLPVVGLGWRVVLLQDQQEVYALVEAFQRNLYWILLFTILVAVIIALMISQNIALPILQVTRGTNELAAGRYDVRISVNNTDEVGQLANNFNFMADSLADKMRELKAAYEELKLRADTIEQKNIELDRKVFEVGVLYKIGRTMVEVGLDLEKLLDVIIDKAIEAACATRGSLMLIDENQEVLELQRVRIWDAEAGKTVAVHNFARNINIRVGEGIAGKVLQSGEMAIINDPDSHQDFKQYDNEKNRVNQLVCVPLKVKNVTFGVINIVNRKDGQGFNRADTDLLQTMANQAALVLDNTKLFKLAITDGLTGLNLVRHFRNRLNEEIKRARRYGKIFSILFFDIDHFKKFNDTYGHQIGDEVLKQVATIFRGNLREDIDMAARYGGEEMIALLPETDASGGMVVAERLRKAIEAHEFTGHTSPLKVTISIGLAEYPLHSTEALELIRKADTALYECKKRGRNQSSIYSEQMGVVSEK